MPFFVSQSCLCQSLVTLEYCSNGLPSEKIAIACSQMFDISDTLFDVANGFGGVGEAFDFGECTSLGDGFWGSTDGARRKGALQASIHQFRLLSYA